MFKIIGADQKEYGPVSAEQVREWIAQGRANAQTKLQAAGSTDWKPLAEFPEFVKTLIGFADGHAEMVKAGRLDRLRWEP